MTPDPHDISARLDKLEATICGLHDVLVRSTPPQLMTTRECASYVQLSVERLFQMRKRGEGPKYLQPTERTVRYRLEDVDTWLNQN